MDKIILGSRGSQLALWQTHNIMSLLKTAFPEKTFENKIITTKGDRIQDKPLPEIGAKGLFTEEIEDALLDETIHIAVHSLKDLPSTLPDGLEYAGSPKRADVRDAFISTRWESLDEVPEDGKIATGSTRRRALLLSQNPGLTIGGLRGNIDTRLRKLEEEGWDGIIMAAAALKRLNLGSNVTEELDPETFVPSVGQGAIGLEVKSNRLDIINLVNAISDDETVSAVKSERAFMRELEGGCSVPIGAWGRVIDNTLLLTGYFSNLSGKRYIRESLTGDISDPETLGVTLANRFKELNVKELMSQ